MPVLWPQKDPDEVLDYELNWSRWLKGDTIIASQWTVPDGLTMIGNGFQSTYATVWLSGGSLGETYILANKIQTAQGRTREETVSFGIAAR